MKIGPKLTLSKSVLLVLLLIQASAIFWLNQTSRTGLEESLIRLRKLSQVQEEILDAQASYSRSIRFIRNTVYNNTKEIYFPKQFLEARFRIIKRELQMVMEAQKVVHRFWPTIEALELAHLHLTQALNKGDEKKILLTFQNWQLALRKTEAYMSDLVQLATINLEQQLQTVIAKQNLVEIWTLILFLACLLYTGLSLRYFLRKLVLPLVSITRNVLNFKNSKSALAEIPSTHDEIEDLARGIHNMQVAVIQGQTNLLEANEKLKRYAAITAHDLKSPLTTISGYLNLIEMDFPLDPELKSYYSKIKSILRRALETITGLSKLSMGKSALEIEKFALDEVVQEVVEDLAHHIESHQASLIVGTLGDVRADRTLVREALKNLVANSLNYGRKDTAIKIEISAQREAPGPSTPATITLKIKDNGLGFAPGEIQAVLRPFTRGTSANNSNPQGSGLGLSICKEIMELHDGELSIQSPPQGGSTISLTFPLLHGERKKEVS